MSSAGYSPDGRWIVTSADDNTARVWNATSGQQILTLQGHSHYLSSAGSQDMGAIGTKRSGIDPVDMALKNDGCALTVGLPNSHGMVFGCGDDASAIGIEFRRPDSVEVALKDDGRTASVRVPDVRRLV